MNIRFVTEVCRTLWLKYCLGAVNKTLVQLRTTNIVSKINICRVRILFNRRINADV
jgi:hypothetical protein